MKMTCILDNKEVLPKDVAITTVEGAETQRPITRDTVFLCHKWFLEGYSVREIAYTILECEEERVRNALATPLSIFQEKNIKKYFNPRKLPKTQKS